MDRERGGFVGVPAALPPVGSAEWLLMRRKELAVEWSNLPTKDVQTSTREAQDIAWALGIDILGMSKRQIILAIQAKGLTMSG